VFLLIQGITSGLVGWQRTTDPLHPPVPQQMRLENQPVDCWYIQVRLIRSDGVIVVATNVPDTIHHAICMQLVGVKLSGADCDVQLGADVPGGRSHIARTLNQ
jgi:hypothetical protein